jgi:hypothetical protein
MKYKLGEWYKYDNNYIVQVTEKIEAIDGIKYRITYNDNSTNVIEEGTNRRGLVHLPHCTSYNWKPLQIPDGYRKLEIGEVPVVGDLWSVDGVDPFQALSMGSYMVYQKNPIPPMSERIVGATGFGTYDPGAIWVRKVEKWVPYTFDTCPAIVKVIQKCSKEKYAARLDNEKLVQVGAIYITFKELFEQYTDINGGPLGTTE